MSHSPINPHLIYFADPMCSWCYGFSPTIAKISQGFGARLPIQLVLGGLRPGNTKPMGEQDKASIASHWQHVHEASGQIFDHDFFKREGFVYDTEPASRALVVMRHHSMALALKGLERLHRAFYAENRDVTDIQELAGIAAELGLSRASFLEDFQSDTARAETHADFAFSQRVGIRGFPTLIAGSGRDNRYEMVTNGYQSVEALLPGLTQWRDGLDEAPEAAATAH